MKTILSAAAVLAMLSVPAGAEVRYDAKIEKAAMMIVAAKMGDLRGGFSYAQQVQFVGRQDRPASSSKGTPAAISVEPGQPSGLEAAGPALMMPRP